MKVVDVRFTSDFVLLIRLMQFLLWEIKFLGVALTISYPRSVRVPGIAHLNYYWEESLGLSVNV